MAFNVNEMLGTINGVGGLTKSSKFIVRITPPASLRGLNSTDFQFLCDSAALPGISMQTDEIRMSGYGNIEKRPYAPIFQDVNLTFFCDSNARVLKFFQQWVQSVYAFNDNSNPNGVVKTLPPNTFAYPKDYFGIVEIEHYDDSGPGQSGEGIVLYSLNEAYPVSIGDIALDWNNENQLTKIPITFSYTWWTASTLSEGEANERTSLLANALQQTQSRVGAELSLIRQLIYRDPFQFINGFANQLPDSYVGFL